MTVNSPVYWEANDFPLHTYGWSVTSFSGARWTGPAKVGEDLKIPFRRGRMRQRKSRDSKQHTLIMTVSPLTEDGVIPADLEQQVHENYRRIVGAMDVEGQFDLVKRWFEDGTVWSATARAEYIDSAGPSTDDFTSFDYSIDLMLADPYFYRGVAAQAVGTLDVEGDVPTDRVTLTMGPGRVTNTRDGNWIEYNGTGTAVINCRAASAKKGSQYVNGLVKRNPAFPDWMTLYPGENVLTGAGTVAYDAAYR